MFKRILIANRGEIARRVARTCQKLEIESVGVYSEADESAAFLKDMTKSIAIGAASPAKSYLNIERIIDAALQSGCEAIHPGYGFLSENANFAAAVEAAGLVFIGPTPEVIGLLGDKGRAKQFMYATGIPIVPGSSEATQDTSRLLQLAINVGFPLLIKPSAGGGGKGMHVVNDIKELPNALDQAIRLATANFGNGQLILERYIDRPRHIEVQIMGDGKGQAVHLFERECSLQRRHQKVLEESPAVRLDAEVRVRLLNAAVQGAKAMRYRNAGTFEFIIDQLGHFYFLEVNTRLQVEHPVTEQVTGIDLVEWQLLIASGQGLPSRQKDIKSQGVAIEVRLYAEDPAKGFLPSPGYAECVLWPKGARVEAAFDSKGEVPSFYDPLVAKLIVHAPNRGLALKKMRAALDDTLLVGLTTNLGFLQQVLIDPDVLKGNFHTCYLDDNLNRLLPKTDHKLIAVIGALFMFVEQRRKYFENDLWLKLSGQRHQLVSDGGLGTYSLWVEAQLLHVHLHSFDKDHEMTFSLEGQKYETKEIQFTDGLLVARVNDQPTVAKRVNDRVEITLSGVRSQARAHTINTPFKKIFSGQAFAPMHGVVTTIDVNVGQFVQSGDRLLVIEAMKMENPVFADVNGKVLEICCILGQQVSAHQILVYIQGIDK